MAKLLPRKESIRYSAVYVEGLNGLFQGFVIVNKLYDEFLKNVHTGCGLPSKEFVLLVAGKFKLFFLCKTKQLFPTTFYRCNALSRRKQGQRNMNNEITSHGLKI